MKIIIEIGHPAHVHFFRGIRTRLLEQGHKILVLTRDKSVTHSLLARYKIPYVCLSKARTGLLAMAFELLLRWGKTCWHIYRFKADTLVSISGITTALPGRMCHRRTLTFTDTEDATLSNQLAFPFSDKIITPEFFLQTIGRKHLKYRGLHELSYLQGELIKPRPIVEPYVILRLINPTALHDQDIQELNVSQIDELINFLKVFGRVVLSSEKEIPSQWKSYQFNDHPDHMLNWLRHSSLFVGESPTMAVESALMGVPSFLITSRASRLGNMIGLTKLKLLHCYPTWDEAKEHIPKSTSELESLKAEHQKNISVFLRSCVDMTNFATHIITETTSCVD